MNLTPQEIIIAAIDCCDHIHTDGTGDQYVFRRGDALEFAAELTKRATPAAASAGAAGTIDTPTVEFWNLVIAYAKGTGNEGAALEKHYMEAVAAAREEGRQAGIQQERALWNLSAEGQAQATEGGKPVIGCPDPLHIFAEHCERDGYPSDDADTQAMLWKYFTHGMAWLGAATAPVSAAPTADEWRAHTWHGDSKKCLVCDKPDWMPGPCAGAPQSAGAPVMRALVDACNLAMKNTLAARIPECGDFAEIAQNLSWAIDEMKAEGAPVSTAPDAWITPQVAQNLDRQYRDGFQDGWTACIDGNEEALGAVLNRVKPLADYQEGAPVSAAPAGDLEKLAREFAKWSLCMSYNDSYFGEPAGELKRIAKAIDRLPAGAPVSAAEPAPSFLDELKAAPKVDIPAWKNHEDGTAILAQAGGQQLPTTYSLIWESASMEPDPAGEWVKRADLAMGQQVEMIDVKKLGREARNKVCIDGYLNAALNAIRASNSPDGNFNLLGALAGDAIDIALRLVAAKPAGKKSK